MRRRWLLTAGLAVGLFGAATAHAQADRLPSWNDGLAKKASLDFVSRTTTAGAPGFAGTRANRGFRQRRHALGEQPVHFQFAFALDRVKALAPQHPEWREREPFKFALAGDMAGLAATGEKGLLEIVAATHAGMTTEEFSHTVEQWIATALHPRPL